jgi:predicted DNA-binding protein YlxM (UPF0122 family)
MIEDKNQTVSLQEVADAEGVSRQAVHKKARKRGLAVEQDRRGRQKLTLAEVGKHFPSVLIERAQIAKELREFIAKANADPETMRVFRLFVKILGGGYGLRAITNGLERINEVLASCEIQETLNSAAERSVP